MSAPIMKVVRLEDDRWGCENGEGVTKLTDQDLSEIASAVQLWLYVRYQQTWRVSGG